ncbi:hypothetical protein D9M71_228760 [compost metagenome]
MGMVPKNIDTVEWAKICRASSKNISQRAAYNTLNRMNRAMVSHHKASAVPCRLSMPICIRARAKTPVPMVAANQLGVN